MEETTQGAAPTAVLDPPADATPSEQSEAGGSGGRPASSAPTQDAQMNAFLRGVAIGDPTSKPADETDPTDGAAPDLSGDAQKAGGPERGPDGRYLPRRGVPKAIAEHEQTIEDLKQQLAARDPEAIRRQVLAEQQAEANRKAAEAYDEDYLGNEQTYQAALQLPTSETDYQPAPDGKGTLTDWIDERRVRRKMHPHVERHWMSAAQQTVATKIDAAERAHQQHLHKQLTMLAAKPGVEGEVFAKLPTFGELGNHLYEAGQRSRQSEIDERDRTIAEQAGTIERLRSNGLGSTRAPAPPGRSSAAGAGWNGDAWIRGLSR